MSLVKTERRGHVWMMGLDRAAKRNAFSLELLRDLSDAYTALEEDPELRCGLLYAEGEHFIESVEAVGGTALLDRVWEGPENVPGIAEIRNPHDWVSRMSLSETAA